MSRWATEFIEVLEHENFVEFRPMGRSMEPLIRSGQPVRVRQYGSWEASKQDPKVNDIVLCDVNGDHYLHRIGATSDEYLHGWYRIENAAGHINGWVKREHIYGYVEKII